MRKSPRPVMNSSGPRSPKNRGPYNASGAAATSQQVGATPSRRAVLHHRLHGFVRKKSGRTRHQNGQVPPKNLGMSTLNRRRRTHRGHPFRDVHGQETGSERVRSPTRRPYRQQLDPRSALTTTAWHQSEPGESEKRRAFPKSVTSFPAGASKPYGRIVLWVTL